MNSRILSTAVATAFALNAGAALAQQQNSECPPRTFSSGNLVKGGATAAGFERCGARKTWTLGNPDDNAAQPSWKVHSNNAPLTKPVTTECVPSTAPGANGATMLHAIVGAHESGVYQDLRPTAPRKAMISAWVFVNRGQVMIGAHATTPQPTSTSTKIGQWEQLRVCTDGTVPTDLYWIWNQNATGADFYVDNVEIRAIP